MGWLTTPNRFLKPGKTRFVFLIIGAVAFVVTEFGRYVCRPYVRSHGLNDFGLTDSIGNLGGILVQIFLFCAIVNATKEQSFRLATFFSLGYVVYEFLQPVLPKGVFDWNDVFGTVIGYFVSLSILLVIWWLIPTMENKQDLFDKGDCSHSK
ncbi:hypothetical protein ACFL5K_05905 [Gemmatimonadota bacterium]